MPAAQPAVRNTYTMRQTHRVRMSWSPERAALSRNRAQHVHDVSDTSCTCELLVERAALSGQRGLRFGTNHGTHQPLRSTMRLPPLDDMRQLWSPPIRGTIAPLALTEPRLGVEGGGLPLRDAVERGHESVGGLVEGGDVDRRRLWRRRRQLQPRRRCSCGPRCERAVRCDGCREVVCGLTGTSPSPLGPNAAVTSMRMSASASE